MQTIDEAVDATPDNSRLVIRLADLCLRFQQPRKARHLLESAAELEPENQALKLLLAKTCLLAREPEEALAILKDFPGGIARPGEVALMRGVALALTGNPEAALPQLNLAIDVDPQNVDYLIVYAWLQQLLGRHTEALSTLGKVQKLAPVLPQVPYRMAVSYFAVRQYVSAADACKEAIRLDPTYDASYFLLGVVRLAQEDFKAAQDALQRAVALRPHTALFHHELGLALMKVGSLTESKKELDEALALNPKGQESYFWRAQLFVQQGDRKSAIADLETAIALDPNFAKAYVKLAQLYKADGNSKKAKEVLTNLDSIRTNMEEDERKQLLLDLDTHFGGVGRLDVR
jgi:tetratricopeptide (TPR) repeat protein